MRKKWVARKEDVKTENSGMNMDKLFGLIP
jgi:hypothetical protein